MKTNIVSLERLKNNNNNKNTGKDQDLFHIQETSGG